MLDAEASHNRDMQLVAWIDEYLRVNRFAPSMRELGKEFGLKSSSTIWVWLARMHKAGKVEWVAKEPRTLRTIHDE